MKRIIILLLLVSIFSTLTLSTVAHSQDALQTFQIEKLIELQQPAKAAYVSLIESFPVDKTTPYGDVIYPDSYAGSYIDDNILIIMVVDMDESFIKEIHKRLTEHDGCFEFKAAKYSRSTLSSLAKDVLANNLDRLIVNVSTDTIENKIYVGVDINANISSRNKIEGVINEKYAKYDDAIEVILKEPIEFAGTLIGGDTIYKGVNGAIKTKNGTVGYTYQQVISYYPYYRNLMLTAGHVALNPMYDSSATNAILFGSVIYNNYATWMYPTDNYSYADYAIVELNSAFTPSSRVRIGTGSNDTLPIQGLSTAVSNTPVVGEYVTKYGYNTGYTIGMITNDNDYVPYTIPSSGKHGYILGLYKVKQISGYSKMADGGDSGGPVWFTDSSGLRRLTGIVTATENPTYNMYFSLTRYMNLNP